MKPRLPDRPYRGHAERPAEVFGGREQISDAIEKLDKLGSVMRDSGADIGCEEGFVYAMDLDDLDPIQRYEAVFLAENGKKHGSNKPPTMARLLGSTFKVNTNNHRAKVLGLEYSLTDEQWFRIVAAFDGRCAYCNDTSVLEMDHIVPVSCGGGSEKMNVVPACHKCNRLKKTMPAEKFVGGKRLSEIMRILLEANP